MTLGVSLFLFAVGAILTWAVNVETEAIDLDIVGVILMVVGAIGFIAGLIFWGSRRRTVHGHGEIVHEHEEEGPPL